MGHLAPGRLAVQTKPTSQSETWGTQNVDRMGIRKTLSVRKNWRGREARAMVTGVEEQG